MNLLLISNSTNPGEQYLEYPEKDMREFCQRHNVTDAVFIPYAGVTFSFDQYEEKVQKRFSRFSVRIHSIHRQDDPVKAVEEASAIIVGGGNTFMLVSMLQRNGLMEPIRKKVLDGTPYIGWSAGSNITCPTLCTTNDMPIVQPQSFSTLDLIPFQINPHYTDARLEGHGGETREQRILEYIEANRDMYVAGLRESCMFLVEGDICSLIGPRKLRVFKYGQAEPAEYGSGDDISFLFRRS